jgi:hypothetical protein
MYIDHGTLYSSHIMNKSFEIDHYIEYRIKRDHNNLKKKNIQRRVKDNIDPRQKRR